MSVKMLRGSPGPGLEEDMNDKNGSYISRPQISTGRWLAIVCVATLLTGVVVYLASLNKGFEISIGDNGQFSIGVRPDETFATLLNKAIQRDRSEVDAILARQQYYSLTNPDLVGQLEHLDAAKPESQEISNRLRRLLWDLRGPFKIPYTLSGADERMTQALDALETERKETKQASALLVALWEKSLEGHGIFWPRSFNATVEIVQGAPAGNEERKIVLACPGSAIAHVSGVVMSLHTNRANILADVIQEPALFDCGGSVLTARQLLAEEGTAQLGLSERAFKELVPASESVNEHGKTDAKFILYPQYMVSAR
jgi:hypothetical protein